MTSTLASAPTTQRATAERPRHDRRRQLSACATPQRTGEDPRSLALYTTANGDPREVIARAGAGGSTLVVDRRRATDSDARLVAHIAPDEPAENAALVCRQYLQDARGEARRCRPLTADDTTIAPFSAPSGADAEDLGSCLEAACVDRLGCSYAIQLVAGEMAIPELRWCRRAGEGDRRGEPVSMREAIGALESYQAIHALTLRALSRHRRGGEVSTTVLRAELARVQASPIVLNRRLREAVVAAVQGGELSMSEIAIRCGRVKRDRRGNESGETSWLARRLGLAPEGGQSAATPWIHSDVLALIARRGLGVSPREVEL